MSRRNIYLLLTLAVVCLACYVQVGSARRNSYGRVVLDTMEEIHRNYLENVTDRELFEAAMSGMADRLDEYSAYLPPDSFREFNENLEHRFGGVGIQVVLDRKSGLLTVVTPLVGTPAFDAGILAGDQIVEINGEPTEGISIEEAVKRMRGPIGESVDIKVLHPGQHEPVPFTLTREQIEVDTVLGDARLPDGSWDYFLTDHREIGYIRVVAFSEKTVDDLRAALDWLVERKMQGLVLDLRGNPGGLLESAVEISDMFLDEGRIVSTRGRDGQEKQIYTATREGTYGDFPMAILVNFGSASASEIVAAALQDHGRAVIVGERTYGKGSVQNVIPLEGGTSALKLTVASYWRPSGQNIHRGRKATDEDAWGVLPNDGYEVKLEEEQLRAVVRARRERDIVRSPDSAPPEIPDDEPVEEPAESTDSESSSKSETTDSASDSDEAESAVPAVDTQLEKAVDYIEDQLSTPQMKAA